MLVTDCNISYDVMYSHSARSRATNVVDTVTHLSSEGIQASAISPDEEWLASLVEDWFFVGILDLRFIDWVMVRLAVVGWWLRGGSWCWYGDVGGKRSGSR